MSEILVRKIITIVNTIATSIQLVQFVNSSLPIRLVRSPEREREHRAKLDEIGSTIDGHNVHTNFMYSQVAHIYTVNNKKR